MKDGTLAALRARRGWTQPQAADHFGFSRRTWEGWEAGRKAPAGLFDLFARILDMEDELARLKEPAVSGSAGRSAGSDPLC